MKAELSISANDNIDAEKHFTQVHCREWRNPKLRSEFGCLGLPLIDNGSRAHYEHPHFCALQTDPLKPCEELDCLAQAHLVGEQHSELRRIHLGKEAKTGELVGAQRCIHRGW
jgi:hypothetical protein